MDTKPSVEAAIAAASELEAEREVSSIVSTQGEALAYARAALHQWVDSVVGVVAAAGSGRVTLVHANGNRSGVSSPDLAHLVTPPVNFIPRAE